LVRRQERSLLETEEVRESGAGDGGKLTVAMTRFAGATPAANVEEAKRLTLLSGVLASPMNMSTPVGSKATACALGPP
jgi:hypothetical protein